MLDTRMSTFNGKIVNLLAICQGEMIDRVFTFGNVISHHKEHLQVPVSILLIH